MSLNTPRSKCALVMAGGTGGHIFPGLALAQALRESGWRVHWLGTPTGMEAQLVSAQGFAFEPVQFGGVRGKGLQTLALLPRIGVADLVITLDSFCETYDRLWTTTSTRAIS